MALVEYSNATFSYLLTHCAFWAECVGQLLKNCDVRQTGNKTGTQSFVSSLDAEAALPRYTLEVLRAALYLDTWSSEEAPGRCTEKIPLFVFLYFIFFNSP